MIQASELRIRNWVRVTFSEDENGFGNDYNSQVVAIQGAKVLVKDDHHWHPIDKIEPIELSPEILEKIDWNGYIKFNIGSYFKIDDVGHLYYHGDYTGININFVHQLQNIYFALRGEELTINF